MKAKLFDRVKMMWQNKKLLIMNSFSFYHMVFKWYLLLRHQKASVCGKELTCSRRLFENIVTKEEICHRLSIQLCRFSMFRQNTFKVVCCRIVVWGKELIIPVYEPSHMKSDLAQRYRLNLILSVCHVVVQSSSKPDPEKRVWSKRTNTSMWIDCNGQHFQNLSM